MPEKMMVMNAPYDPVLIEKIKSIPNRRWSPERKAWLIPATYREQAQRLYDEWQSGTVQIERPVEWDFVTPPWGHQIDALEFAYAKEGVLLYHYMGLGKSATTINVLRNRGHERILIVCPKSVVTVWGQQFERHSLAGEFSVYNLDTSSVTKNLSIARQALKDALGRVALVVNYDAVWRAPFGAWALKQQWDCIICDESQRIKAPGTRSSRFMYRLGFKAKQRLGLSGTPMPHSPMDVYGQFRFLAPHIFGTNYKKMQDQFCIMGGFQGYQVIGYRNTDEFYKRFYSITHKVDASVLDLPEKHHIDVPVKMPADVADIYKELEKEFYVEVEAGEVTADNALVKLLRLQQITSGALALDDGTVRELHTAKRDTLGDILAGIDGSEPVVVFARFRRDLEAICKAAIDSGRQYYELSGTAKDLSQWQNDTGGSVIGVQISAGSVGIDLTRARYCVFYSVSFSLGEYDQAISRLHRPGQGHQVTYWHLIVPGSVDAKVYQAFERRRDIIRSIVEGD